MLHVNLFTKCKATQINEPDCDDISEIKLDSVHLSNENGSNSLVQCRSIHVHRRTDRDDEPCDTFINVVVFLQAAKCDGQGRWATYSF